MKHRIELADRTKSLATESFRMIIFCRPSGAFRIGIGGLMPKMSFMPLGIVTAINF
jgi:hypothetical protein